MGHWFQQSSLVKQQNASRGMIDHESRGMANRWRPVLRVGLRRLPSAEGIYEEACSPETCRWHVSFMETSVNVSPSISISLMAQLS